VTINQGEQAVSDSMSTKKSHRKSDDSIEKMAAQMVIDRALLKYSEIVPFEIASSISSLGARYKEMYLELLEFVENEKLDIDELRSVASLELWMSAHLKFFYEKLSANADWTPCDSPDEEQLAITGAFRYGLADTVFAYGPGHDLRNMPLSMQQRYGLHSILTLHCLAKADQCASRGESADSFDWLWQVGRANVLSFRFRNFAQGIEVGQHVGKCSVARQGGKSRWEGTVEAEERATAKSEWDRWQIGEKTYSSTASFARAMISQFRAIQDIKTIERWCRDWSKDLNVTEAVNDLPRGDSKKRTAS
jgi:hypothetical protein